MPPEDQDTDAEQLEQARQQAGAGHRDESIELIIRKKQTPKCAVCKRWMGYDDGMYIIVSGPWRLHIKCFDKVVEERFEAGEILDMETGLIVDIDNTEAES